MEDTWTRGDVALVVGFAVAIILLPFKLSEQAKRKKLIARIEDPLWLAESTGNTEIANDQNNLEKAFAEANGASLQECYNHSSRIIDLLKGVLADPTEYKLNRFNGLIGESINLNDQTWQDASLRLAETFHKYDKEYEALVLTIAENSTNSIKLHVAHKLVTSFPELSGTVDKVAAAVLASPAVRTATTLTPR